MSTTLAHIVLTDPGAARVFERHQLDYCCHGERSLDVACREAGLDVVTLQRELEAAAIVSDQPAPPDDIATLIGYIVTNHHRFLRRELPRLAVLMDKVIGAHAGRHPELHDVAATLAALESDLVPHLMKEERVLFPLVFELLGAVGPTSFHCGTVMNPIRVMLAEHDAVGDLLAQLHHQTDGFTAPHDACPTWQALDAGLAELSADVHQHVHLENNLLFPKILELDASVNASTARWG